MLELIYKQASMKAICDGCFKSSAVDLELRCRGTCNVIDILQQQPTIEAEPIRHGYWVNDTFCSECKKFPIPADVSCSISDKELTRYFSRCPHCGAWIDGGADNG